MKKLLALFLCLVLSACGTVQKSTKFLSVPDPYVPGAPFLLDNPEDHRARLQEFLTEHTEYTEDEKINFLLKSIRTSGATFFRNGETYNGVVAVFWLRRKLWRMKTRGYGPQSARDFIERSASHSNTTLIPYEIIHADGQRERTNLIFNYELDLLENAIEARKKLMPMGDQAAALENIADTVPPTPILLPATN